MHVTVIGVHSNCAKWR